MRVPCLDGISNHPRIGWPTSRADDEGPGAPATAAANPDAKTLRGGAPVPDGENAILKHARACRPASPAILDLQVDELNAMMAILGGRDPEAQ